jgi:hypothetical protein
MTKAFGYLRVSGDSQIDGDGFPRQLAAIKAYAKQHDVRIVKVFREEGVTGTKETMDRPAWVEMMTALHANGVKSIIIERLDRLARFAASTSTSGSEAWLPEGLLNAAEPKLGETQDFLNPEIREKLTSWWLVNRRGANTPNWDVVSSCTIEGIEGLILIEAKAHDTELKSEGKSTGDKQNHEQIGSAIREANLGLSKICPGWLIHRDTHYQLCNRFAWAWKVASFGIPVIIIYLGFLHADEMARCGRPFSSHLDWRALVLDHSKALVPTVAWESRLQTSGAPMWAIVRSLDLQWEVGN